jgi:hypothetical protein
MTTRRNPDDLASALLDGELTDDEAAAARRDPAVVARLAEFRAGREAVAGPVPLADPAVRERTLAAALAAFDAGEDERTPAPVTPHPTGEQPWRPEGGRRRRWLAAAAVVLVVVGVGVLARAVGSGDGDTDNAATGGEDSVAEDSSSGGDETSGGGGEGTADAPTSEGGLAAGDADASNVVDLGAAGSDEALADQARAAIDEQTDARERTAEQDGSEPAPAQPACGELYPAAGGSVVLDGRATLAGEPVDVQVIEQADGSLRLIAIDASCTAVVDRALDG